MHETRPFAIFTLLAFVFSFLVFVDMAAIASGAKKALRTRLKSRAKELTPEALMRESKKCCELLFNTDIYKKSSVLSVYLSMKTGEIQTEEIISNALTNRKRVFIPKVTGSESHNMVMVEIFSPEEVDSFPKSKWGIPEPQLPPDFVDMTRNGGIIDLVIVPGTGFDPTGCRLGHGKGYYDTFLDGLAKANDILKLDSPKTIGLSLGCQMVQEGEIPMEKHDRRLDLMINSFDEREQMNTPVRRSNRDVMMDELISSSSQSNNNCVGSTDASSKKLLVRGCDPIMAERAGKMLPPLLGNVNMIGCTNDDDFFSLLKNENWDVIAFAPGACRYDAAKKPIPGGNEHSEGWGLQEYKREVRKILKEKGKAEDVPIVGTAEEKEMVPLLREALNLG